MDIILIYPPNRFIKSEAKVKGDIWPPLGLLYLASVLEKEGISVKIIDAISPYSPKLELEDFIDIIQKEEPKIVAFSATTPQLRGAVQLASRIKEIFGKDIVTGIGGIHVNADSEFINHVSCFDFSLVGEGEITFPKLVKKILKGENVKGTFHAELPIHLDDIPFPARHLVDKNDYFVNGQEFGTLIYGRGCPYRCIFCSNKANAKQIRYRSPKNMVDEIEELIDEYNGNFYFVDNSFTISKKNVFRLCEEIVSRKLDIRWSCQTRFNFVNEKLLRAMRAAGCTSITFGVESGSERVRNDIIKKKITDDQIFNTLKLCKKVGIGSQCYLMVGFPTETQEDISKTIDIVSKLETDIIGIHTTMIMPGSDLFDYAINEGRLSRDFFYKYARGELEGSWPIYVPEGLSIDDLRKARKDTYRKFFFRPQYILRRFINDLTSWNKLKNDIWLAKELFLYGSTPYSRTIEEYDFRLG